MWEWMQAFLLLWSGLSVVKHQFAAGIMIVFRDNPEHHWKSCMLATFQWLELVKGFAWFCHTVNNTELHQGACDQSRDIGDLLKCRV